MPLLWLHSTKKEQLFARTWGSEVWSQPTLVTMNELTAHSAQLIAHSWCGELIPEHQSILHLPAAKLSPLQDILPAFLDLQHYGPDILEPWYGRGF